MTFDKDKFPTVVDNGDGTITYPLIKPISLIFRGADGERTERVERVSLKVDVTAKDLRVQDEHSGYMGKMIALVAHLSGLTVGQVDKISAADITVLIELAGGF